MAPAKPPVAEATMTASEVAMNSALPSPQPARKPTMPLIEPDSPASAEKTTMIDRPVISVFFAPIRLETQPVPSIATAGTTRELVNRRLTWLGVAFSCWERAGRIGSTRPMPMKLTTQAKATAKTAFGCRNMLVPAAELTGLLPGGQGAGAARIRGPGDQPLVGQPRDERGHRRLAHPLGDGQLGEPGRAGALQAGQGRCRGQAQPGAGPGGRPQGDDGVVQISREFVRIHTVGCNTQLCISATRPRRVRTRRETTSASASRPGRGADR